MNHTVQKALNILKLVSNAPTGLGISEIGKALGIAKSTVFDIVHTLEADGMLEQADERGHTYLPGSGLCRLGFQYLARHDLTAIARSRLTRLRDETCQTVFMAVRDKLQMVYAMKLESDAQIQLSANVGTVSEILCSGLGKVAFAAMTDDQICAVATADMFAYSNDPEIYDIPSLLAYVHAARERGFVTDSGANGPIRIRSVAVPILRADGAMVAAVSVVSLQDIMTAQRRNELGQMAMNAALDISRNLGYLGGRVLFPI